MSASTPVDAETYETILTANLQRAIDFVKFAEAKNAALLALSSAWVLATVNLECSGKSILVELRTSIVLALACSLCAAIIAMTSFFPRLHLPGFLGGKKAGPHPPNLLYFGDISSLPIRTLKADLHNRYFPSGNPYSDDYIHDLIVQIGVNSQIAKRKMRFFSWGVTFILIAGIVFFIPVMGMLYQSIRGL
jgi:hypothetical protein